MHGANHSGHRRSVLQRPAQGSFTSACAAAAAVDLDLSVTGPLTQSYIWSLNCFLGGLTGAWGGLPWLSLGEDRVRPGLIHQMER